MKNASFLKLYFSIICTSCSSFNQKIRKGFKFNHFEV